MAEAYGLGVGDRIGFNVLGRVIEAEIAQPAEEIDWGRGAARFRVHLQPGRARGRAAHLRGRGRGAGGGRAACSSGLAAELPNVTPISVRELVAQLERTLGRSALAVAAVGGVTLLAGTLVLAGARRRRTPAPPLPGGRAQGPGRAARSTCSGCSCSSIWLGRRGAIAGAIIGGIGAEAWWLRFRPAVAFVAVVGAALCSTVVDDERWLR